MTTAHRFYSQFHDKIDQILESLERIAERLRQPPSISAEVEKIKEQIGENKSVSVDMEKLQPLYETLRQRGEEMIARSEGTEKDVSARGDEMGSACLFVCLFSLVFCFVFETGPHPLSCVCVCVCVYYTHIERDI